MNNDRNLSTVSLKTRRLTLRRVTLADLDFMVDLFSRSELVAHRPLPEPDSAAATAGRLSRDMAHWDQHGFGRWAIERDGGVIIGFGGLTMKSGFEGLNLSYHLHPAAWGHGYASEFATEAVSVAFSQLQATRVIGLVRPSNPASRRVLERSGFAPEGEVMLDGAPTVLLARYP